MSQNKGRGGTDGNGDGSAVSGVDMLQAEIAGMAAEGVLPQDNTQAAGVILAGAQAGDASATAADAQGTTGGIQQPGSAESGKSGAALSGITAALESAAASGTQNAAAPAGAAQAPSTTAAAGAEVIKPGAEKNAAGAAERNSVVMDSTGAEAGVDTGTAPVSGSETSGSGGTADSGVGTKQSNKDETSIAELRGVGTPGIPTESIPDGETAAEKTAAAEKALNRLADDLRSIQSGAQEIRIVLEPESLGVLTISVIKTASGVSCKIKSEDKEIVAAISDQIQRLITSMENKGIRLDDVDVVYSQAENGAGARQENFTQSGNQSSNGQFTPGRDQNQDSEAQSGGFWQEYYGDEKSGDSAVEYRV